MFVDACAAAEGFTRPVITSVQFVENNVGAGIAAFVVLNEEGWVITAAHLTEPLMKLQADKALVDEYDRQIAQVRLEPNTNRKSALRKRIKYDKTWHRRAALWWGADGVSAHLEHVYPPADIMLCQLDNIELLAVPSFPVFKRPNGLARGTSLLRVGYPFHAVGTKWNDASSTFEVEPNSVTHFAIEGILARTIDLPQTSNVDYPVRLLETSSPGLMGQSGGPILDKEAVVYAIQSSTGHYPLGFAAQVVHENKTITEHQVLNVGRGISTATLEILFAKHSIQVQWVD